MKTSLILLLFASPALGGHSWSYLGETGPLHWGTLRPEYMLCAKGKHQSPIDISDSLKKALPRLKFFYKSHPLAVTDNGHSWQVDLKSGSRLKVGTKHFQLVQLHFHTPSEHTFLRKKYPLEIHLVHKGIRGALGVLGILVREGKKHSGLEKIWRKAPDVAGKTTRTKIKINPASFLPTGRKYFHYSGSLTTPPCSEGVDWYILSDSIEASIAQIKKFKAHYSGNARPAQKLNERIVLRN